MSTPGGAPAPYVQGQVVSVSPGNPGQMIDPISTAAHDLGALLKRLVVASPGFHNEKAEADAHSVIDSFVHHLTPAKDRAHTVRETDVAPVEDVSKRVSPNQTAQMPVPATGQLDYAKLAQALWELQQRQGSDHPATAAEPDAPLPDPDDQPDNGGA